MSATAEYKPLDTFDDESVLKANCAQDASIQGHASSSSSYPGFRRSWGNGLFEGAAAAPLGPNLTLVPTGGNALQAVDKDLAARSDVMRVVVPNAARPGQTMLVLCPKEDGDGDRNMVSITVPDRAYPGHVLLVQMPPSPTEFQQPRMPVVTGAPVGGVSAPLVTGRPIAAGVILAHQDELELAVEEEVAKTANGKVAAGQ